MTESASEFGMWFIGNWLTIAEDVLFDISQAIALMEGSYSGFYWVGMESPLSEVLLQNFEVSDENSAPSSRTCDW